MGSVGVSVPDLRLGGLVGFRVWGLVGFRVQGLATLIRGGKAVGRRRRIFAGLPESEDYFKVTGFHQ